MKHLWFLLCSPFVYGYRVRKLGSLPGICSAIDAKYYTDPLDNSKFYQCEDGQPPVQRSCAPGTIWSQSMLTCSHFRKSIGSSQIITGHIYCDNSFEFYFNGNLVAIDPITFSPHQAVKVEFEWDGVSPKTYAIVCQDYATVSGYTYTSPSSRSPPRLGYGGLIAQFSDGTVTNSSWSMFTQLYGPTDESFANGCSGTNLSPCEMNETAPPSDWLSSSFTGVGEWTSAKEYPVSDLGWGETPFWVEGKGCCTVTSPITRNNMTQNSGCSVNYSPSAPTTGLPVEMDSHQCIDPKSIFQNLHGPKFLWGNDLERDNKMLFRFTAN